MKNSIIALSSLLFLLLGGVNAKAASNENLIYEQLKTFDKKHGAESYSGNFYMLEEEDFFDHWLDTLCKPNDIDKIKSSVKKFANADGTGGAYAFWLVDENTPLDDAPIVLFGSEGDLTIVADNIVGLLKLLSLGVEPSVFDETVNFAHFTDGDSSYFDKFHSYRPHFQNFRQWMKKELDISPIKEWKVDEYEESEEVVKIVNRAQEKYLKKFKEWSSFCLAW